MLFTADNENRVSVRSRYVSHCYRKGFVIAKKKNVGV